jgi:hypothetical protein
MANASRTYFKVVNTDLKAICQDESFGVGARLQYSIGIMVTPFFQGSKCFVFETFEQAKQFTTYYNDDKIFTCEVLGKPTKPKFVPARYFDIATYWNTIAKAKKSKKKVKFDIDVIKPVEGTVFVDGVRLLHDVTNTVDGKPEVKTYYKVCQLVDKDNTYRSAVLPLLSSHALIYKPFEWTIPTLKNSKIFIFDSIENAMHYAFKKADKMAIFECEAVGVEKAEFMGQCNTSYYFWALPQYKREARGIEPPKGTCYASAVRLNKLVKKINH